MHTKVGEVLYSIISILRILQSLTVPSALLRFIPSISSTCNLSAGTIGLFSIIVFHTFHF